MTNELNLAQRDIGNREEPNRTLSVRLNAGQNEDEGNIAGHSVIGLSYLIKPDNYDGKKLFREFLAHFEFVAKANNWNESAKTVALALCLWGRARSVLELVKDLFKLSFLELKAVRDVFLGKSLHRGKLY